MSEITFVIPNRGGVHIDYVIGKLREFYPNEKYIVVTQEDNEPFKRGQLFNIASKYIETNYICLIDNDIFFKKYVDLIRIYNDRKCKVLQPFNRLEHIELKKDGSYIVKRIGKRIIPNGDNKVGPRGGVTFVSKKTFDELDGFSNLLVGYGYEDNDFCERCGKGGFINIDNSVCHIAHPSRDIKNIHQSLNCVLFNNESKDIHGGVSTTKYTEVYRKDENGILHIGVNNIDTTNNETKNLLELHKPENIRKACEYICDYYFKNNINSDYVLIGVPKHMNIGDTLIWEAEKTLLDKLPHKRIATFFFGTYSHHIKIKDDDTIVFSGGGYLSDIWNGSLKYVNDILKAFPNNKVVFLPNSVFCVNERNPDFVQFVRLMETRKKKSVIFSREQQGFRLSRKRYFINSINVLVPDVVLTWDVRKYLKEHNHTTNQKNQRTLFLDRNDKERKSTSITFEYDVKTDWLQMVKRPEYADVNMRCVDWEKTVKDRLIMETIDFVDSFETVYSNRMHGAILAWLLGKKTYLMDNNYGKSSSLYKTWLLDDTENIKMFN